MAGWFVVVGSLLVVASAYSGMIDLYSLQNRERVQEVLAEGAGPGLGISVDQALSLMRVGLMLSGALAAAAAVAGFFVLRRHRGARTLLAVLALPLLVTTLLTGGLTGALVVAAIATLWSGPARDWYAGRPVRQPAGRGGSAEGSSRPVHPAFRQGPPDASTSAPVAPRPPAGSSGAPAGPPTVSDQPPPTQGFGQAPGSPEAEGRGPSQQPVPPWGPPPQAPWGPQQGSWAAPDQRVAEEVGVPPGVKLACLLTWVFSGLVVLAHLGFAAVLVADPDGLVDYLVKQPAWEQFDVPRDVLLPAMWVYAVGMVLWSLAACGLAFFAWRRHDWARWLLAVSAGVAFLVGLTAFPAGVLHQLACAAALGGLFNVRSRAWFARRPPQPPR